MYHTSGLLDRRQPAADPVLLRESLVGPKQLNSSPDCGASGVKSKSTYGWFGVMQNGQP